MRSSRAFVNWQKSFLFLCICCFSPSCLNRSSPFYQPACSPSPVTCHYCSLPSLRLHWEACSSSCFRLQETCDVDGRLRVAPCPITLWSAMIYGGTKSHRPSNKSNNSMAAEAEIRKQVLQSRTSICVIIHFSLLPLRAAPSLCCCRLTQVYRLLLPADALLPFPPPPSSVRPAEKGLPGRD